MVENAKANNPLLNGQYRLVSYLGGGGFGNVFLAEDAAIPGRKVAIKRIYSTTERENELIIHEMRMLAKIDHPNVVRFYHYFSHNDTLYMVFEYCARGTLSDAINCGEPVATTQVFNWGLILSEALTAIHEAKVIHHDIKPSNILLADDGTLKLGDFGVANTLVGTIAYLSPEMLDESDVNPADPRIDIYALGITLIELLIGKHPFMEMSEEESLSARLTQSFVPDFGSPWAREILLKATHPTRELRFQTAREFADAIRLKHVPQIFDEKHFQAHQLAVKSESALARKKWNSARKLALQSVDLSSACVSANVAAGRAELRMHRLDAAQRYLERALHYDKRAQVQKELGWLKLEAGWVSQAIPLLNEHLTYAPDDFEAYNLLLKCFYERDRFDVGIQLLDRLQPYSRGVTCLESNRFLFELLANPQNIEAVFNRFSSIHPTHHFVQYNMKVFADSIPSFYGNIGNAKSKLLFQEYTSEPQSKSRDKNQVVIFPEKDGQNRFISSNPILSVGRTEDNDLVIPEPSISRRHCAIVNSDHEVWLYDLGSTIGTFVDGQRVKRRAFLLGVHELIVGDVPCRIASSSDLLI